MLVDSGTTNTFINEQLAQANKGVQLLPKSSRVWVADGGELICLSFVPGCAWYSQGHEFYIDLKVLALVKYDVILGMDWLEEHNPMTLDWREESIEIQTPAGPLRLLGQEASSIECQVVNNLQLQAPCNQEAITHIVHLCMVVPESEKTKAIPPSIQAIVNEFPDVFEEPT